MPPGALHPPTLVDIMVIFVFILIFMLMNGRGAVAHNSLNDPAYKAGLPSQVFLESQRKPAE